MRFCTVQSSIPELGRWWSRLDLKPIKIVRISSSTSLDWLVFGALKELLHEQDVYGDCGNDEQETGCHRAASPLKQCLNSALPHEWIMKWPCFISFTWNCLLVEHSFEHFNTSTICCSNDFSFLFLFGYRSQADLGVSVIISDNVHEVKFHLWNEY